MSTTKVTLSDNSRTEILSIRGATVADLLAELTDGPLNETDVLRNFLTETGIDLVIQTPNSTWISEIRFSQVNGEVTFITDDYTPMSFTQTLEQYLEGVKTGEAGRWYHRLLGTYNKGK